MWYIYYLFNTSKPELPIYIGMTSHSLETRLRDHLMKKDYLNKTTTNIQLIEVCDTKKEALYCEWQWITQMKPIHNKVFLKKTRP